MKEEKKKIEFLEEFIDAVEQKGLTIGSREIPFFTEMLTYMNQEDEPSIIFPYIKGNIKVNGYFYDEESANLSLYVVDYDINFDEGTLPETTKTKLTEIANKAKRFYTNSNGIYHSASGGVEFRELARFITNNRNVIDEVNIYVLTTSFYLTNKPVEVNIPGVEAVNVHIWDMDRVYRLSEAEQGIRDFDIELEVDYNQSIEMMNVPKRENCQSNYDFDCYIGYIPADLLAKLYDDWGPKLVERNVRSFLQARGGTNKGIRDTLKDPIQRDMFVSYNNGISSVAKDADIQQIGDNNLYRITRITSWQIVNGGQTTASVHQAYKSGVDLKDVYVQTKLTILKVSEQEEDRYKLEDEIVSKISEYANTQNKINKSDLLANTRFMSDIEKLSRSIWIPSLDNRKEESKWYFERARGQYMVDISRRKKGKEQNVFKKIYPKENVITKVDLAKFFMSWEGFPHISSKGGEEAFKQFMNVNSRFWKSNTNEKGESTSLDEIDSDFYKQLISRKIINSYVTDIVNEMNLKGYRANVIYYTVAMLGHIYGRQINLMEIWESQSVPNQWDSIVKIIAQNALNYLRDSAGDRNVTQWAKQATCWDLFKEESTTVLSQLI
ncbi:MULTISPECIES: AIPR family protein [Bacillus]|uniref:AIPR family protein n=1 Tax=Bacillus TaxID=1386 RepID=UPI0006A87364|nr:AIPR family protein [Bacillus subtilis]NRF45993.1 AIPR family protein [Bacillus subtilis]RRN60754.1 AIPR protein [Bacillus subtilis subsp. subtilis]UQZ50826.1 AIPR protein [Bacillus subtilis]UQZ61475.1 AIPR protein [Bacillus subtilis]CUB32536.1 AIPR protein [Bacillus subtilis]